MIKIQSNKEEFLEYAKAIQRGFGASVLGIGQDLEKWFDFVEESHQEIRAKLGGVQKQITVSIDPPNIDNLIPIEKIQHDIFELSILCPKYFNEYGLNVSHFRKPSIPTVSIIKKHGQKIRNISFGKHIKHYLFKNPTDTFTRNKINKIIINIGQILSEAKTKKAKLSLTITTDPKAFFRIGHYGVDHGSCYGNGAMNESHKYVLGYTKNTFIGVVHVGEPKIESLETSEIFTRFWGYAEPPYNVWHTSNIYPRTPKDGANVLLAIREGFSNIIGTKIKKTPSMFIPSLVYFNTESSLSYHDENIKLIEPQSKEMDDGGTDSTTGIRWTRLCQKCRSKTDNIKEQLCVRVDDSFVCPNCAKTAKECEISGELTFGSYSGRSKDLSKVLTISLSVKNSLYVICSSSGWYVQKIDCYKLANGKFIHKTHASNHHKCENPKCDLWIPLSNKCCGNKECVLALQPVAV